jgi:hypothetical protein
MAEQGANANAPPAEHARGSAAASLRLPDFWPDAPEGWFVFIESKFRVKHVTDESEMFDLVVGCLPRNTIRQVIDVLQRPDQEQPYTVLKRRLLATHELTTFQRIEQLHKMEPLGARKPSELMSHMLEICPSGEDKNKFFLFLFLQRLPRELRVLLTEEDLAEPRDLAAKADRHWAMLNHQHGLVAVMEAAEEDGTVAAVSGARGGRGGRGGRKRGRGGHQQNQQHSGGQGKTDGAAAAATPASNMAPGTVARFAAGLCHFHWCYGDKARQCEPPCKWEN